MNDHLRYLTKRAVSGLITRREFMGRAADVIMSIPSLIFALLMLSIFGTSLVVIVVVIALICAYVRGKNADLVREHGGPLIGAGASLNLAALTAGLLRR